MDTQRRKRKRGAPSTRKPAKKVCKTTSVLYPVEILGSVFQFLPTRIFATVPVTSSTTQKDCAIIAERKEIFPLRSVLLSHASLPRIAVQFYPFSTFKGRQSDMFLALTNVNAMRTDRFVASLFQYMRLRPNDRRFANTLWQCHQLIARTPRQALQTAITVGLVETTRQFLLKYADQLATWVDEHAGLVTAFRHACVRRHYDVVALLLEKHVFDADKLYYAKSGRYVPEHFRYLGYALCKHAYRKDDTKLFALLIRHRAQFGGIGDVCLIRWACKYHAHCIAKYYFAGKLPNERHDAGIAFNQYAIRAATSYNDEVIVRFLLSRPEVDPSWNLSEAHAWAWHHNNAVICRLLRRHPKVLRTQFAKKTGYYLLVNGVNQVLLYCPSISL